MDSSAQSEIAQEFQEFPPFLRIYKDGRIERFVGTVTVPPSSPDPQTGVSSKDVVISPDTGLSARLYLPKPSHRPHKLPILVYIHGGGFCIESASSPTYHVVLNTLAAEANILVVSVDYRLAPEHPLPTAFDDSWDALQWVASGADPCLAEHGDLSRVMVGGDSAGGNIAHDLAMRASGSDLKICKAVLVHPFFWGEEAIGKEPRDPALRETVWAMMKMVWPSIEGLDDPHMNPTAEGAPSLKGLVCSRVLVCVAEKDILKERGWAYYHALASSGWEGEVEMVETEGEEHVFHLLNPTCESAGPFIKRLATFLNEERGPVA